MSLFNEELVAARKAKGLTQEQLAETVHTSRSAVSHWESGRSMPDYDTIRQLSVVLDCTFSLQTVQQNDVPRTEAEPSESEPSATSEPAERKNTKRILILSIVVLAVLLIVGIIVLKPFNRPQAAESNTELTPTLNAVVPPKINTIEWFSAPEQPQNGKPFVVVQFNESPLRLVRDAFFPTGEGWFYTVYLTETNGFALNITSIDTVYFKEHGVPDIFTSDANEISDWFEGRHDVPARSQRFFTGGMPISDNIAGVGVSVTGTDESNTEFVFHAYLPFSKDYRE